MNRFKNIPTKIKGTNEGTRNVDDILVDNTEIRSNKAEIIIIVLIANKTNTSLQNFDVI